jgi:hypothetical protein
VHVSITFGRRVRRQLMIDALAAMETLLEILGTNGRRELRANERIRTEIQDAIVRSGSATSTDAVWHAIEIGDVELCHQSDITVGALVVWSVAINSAAPSLDAKVFDACDAGVSYLSAMPETASRAAKISRASRQAVLVRLELVVRCALTEATRFGLAATETSDHSILNAHHPAIRGNCHD